MRLNDFLAQLEIDAVSANGDIEVEKIAERGEEISENSLLILVKRLSELRKYYNGEGYRVPIAVLCDSDTVVENCACPIIRLPSPRRALSYAYSMLYGIDYDKLKVIGVTGTNGKTTTATLIEKILTFSKKSVGFIGTGTISIGGRIISDDDYSMTTPDPKLLYSSLSEMMKEGCEYCVMEVSSHSLALEKTAPIVFELAVFTNLSSEHSDFHPSMEEYFQTKLKLFKSARRGVFNVDDPYGKRAAELFEKESITVGIISPASVSAFEINDHGENGYEYIYNGQSFKFLMRQRLPGAFNVYNVMSATAATISLGVKPCDARRAIAEIKGICGRCEIIKDEITVIIDYAHTPYALKNLLIFARGIKGSGRLKVLFGCGGERDTKKRPEMARVAEKYADFITVTADNSRKEETASIISDILLGFTENANVTVIPDREAAITEAIASASAGDVVLLVGKGAEKYNIDAGGTHPFDERAIVAEAIGKRRAAMENENQA